MTNFTKILIIIITTYHYVILNVSAAYSVTINTPQDLIYTNSDLTITWTLVGTQTSKATLSILEILSRRETIINPFVDLSKGKEVWKVSVPDGDYELAIADDQNMMLNVISDTFKIYPAPENGTPSTSSTPTSGPVSSVGIGVVSLISVVAVAASAIITAITAAMCVKKKKKANENA